MVLDIKAKREPIASTVEQNTETITYRQTFRIPANTTLADVSLEEGDFLPDNASAEIIAAHTEVDKTPKARAGSLIAVVVAVEDLLWV